MRDVNAQGRLWAESSNERPVANKHTKISTVQSCASPPHAPFTPPQPIAAIPPPVRTTAKTHPSGGHRLPDRQFRRGLASTRAAVTGHTGAQRRRCLPTGRNTPKGVTHRKRPPDRGPRGEDALCNRLPPQRGGISRCGGLARAPLFGRAASATPFQMSPRPVPAQLWARSGSKRNHRHPRGSGRVLRRQRSPRGVGPRSFDVHPVCGTDRGRTRQLRLCIETCPLRVGQSWGPSLPMGAVRGSRSLLLPPAILGPAIASRQVNRVQSQPTA